MSRTASPFATFLAFVAALLAAMLFAAVVSPWVQMALAPWQHFPLHRVFTRLTMLGVVICTIWLLRRQQLLNRKVLGYGSAWWRFLWRALVGLAGGLALMTVALVPLFLLGVREWNGRAPQELDAWLTLALKGFGSGLAVALIEETFFRGAMQGALLRQNARRLALFAVPLFYAAVHFLGRAHSVPADQVNAFSGFVAWQGFFTAFAEPWRILDAFAALYFVGLLLALVRERYGDIAGCIGLHAGFVAVIAVFRKVSAPATESHWSFLVGSFDGLLGIWIAALTAALCIVMTRSRAWPSR